MAFGIFKLIGSENASRMAQVSDPRGVKLMGDISLAFAAVETQRHRGVVVTDDNIERLTHLLHDFFLMIGVEHSAKEVREMVERYLAEHSLPDAVIAPMKPDEILVDHALLDELRVVAAEVKLRFQSPWGNGDLIDIGLGVGDDLSYSNYEWCSPINCATFASTGCDGTHFSLLIVDGEIRADSPVVMTTPANMGRSVIIGENLFDFLCLGSRQGYLLDDLSGSYRSVLEHLIDANWYAGKPASEWTAKPSDEYPSNMLAYLVDRFNLYPWNDAGRFDELQERYTSSLRIPPDVRG